MQHEPVELGVSAHALNALAGGITRYRVERLEGFHDEVGAVWFEAGELYLVSAEILSLAFKIEVVTLTVKTPAEMLLIMQANAPIRAQILAEMREADFAVPPMPPIAEPAPTGPLKDWPFTEWRLEVLKRMEFGVEMDWQPPKGMTAEEYLSNLKPGEAPFASSYSCLTAIGLLFTSNNGSRLLIASDGTPGCMIVSEDEDFVQSYLRQCIVVPVDAYAAAL